MRVKVNDGGTPLLFFMNTRGFHFIYTDYVAEAKLKSGLNTLECTKAACKLMCLILYVEEVLISIIPSLQGVSKKFKI